MQSKQIRIRIGYIKHESKRRISDFKEYPKGKDTYGQ